MSKLLETIFSFRIYGNLYINNFFVIPLPINLRKILTIYNLLFRNVPLCLILNQAKKGLFILKENTSRKHHKRSLIYAIIALVFIMGFTFQLIGKEPIADTTIFTYDTKNNLKTQKLPISSVTIGNELMLVNGDYNIDSDFSADVVAAYSVVALSTSDIEINNKVLQAVDVMFDSAKEKGFKNFLVTSGFRTYEKQREIYDNSQDKSYVQTPGASEHQTGLAVDIAYSGISSENLDDYPEGKWLIDNAWKYGLILRYPSDKTDITKISYEPWHYRYVGVPHAYFCYENNLSYEEYINFLIDEGSYTVKINGTTYTVYYTSTDNGFINVPSYGNYEISIDNLGGYIITAEDALKIR